MGLVDSNNKVNFYDGKVRVVDPDGKEFVKYEPKDYADNICRARRTWTYLKFSLSQESWLEGFVDGKDSGVYMATPLRASMPPMAWPPRAPRKNTIRCTKPWAANRYTSASQSTGRADRIALRR